MLSPRGDNTYVMMMRKRVLSAVAAVAMAAVSLPSVNGANSVSAESYTIPELNIASKGIPDLDCFQFTAEMGAGFNLGNTFDATATNAPANNANTYLESAWVSTKTTKEIVDTIKAAGFDTFRLPVSWHNHLDTDWKIYDEWMDRVQAVVDYAIDNDMYVILNIHHDNETAYMYPDYDHLDNSKNYVSTIWSQISTRFADYDDHLIFETMNEPRLVGSTYEWWYTSSASECVMAADCINQINQAAVDTIRAAGGNNANRYIMVPGYAAKVEAAIASEFKMPTDTVANRLMLSTHAYIPYNFAMSEADANGSYATFSSSDKTEIDNLMDTLYIKFISKNIPVVMGEFGARNKNENTQARVDYAAYYMASARARGVTCCWWDNECFNTYAGEAFGLLNRSSRTWNYPEIAQALVKYGSGKDATFIPPTHEDIDDENNLKGDILPDGTITFSQAIGDKVILDIELDESCTFANGCLAFDVAVDGVTYWVSFQWSTKESGTLTVDLSTPFNAVVNDTAVEDEALLAKIAEAAQASTTAQLQYWWASDSEGEGITPVTDYVTVVAAAISSGTSEEDPDETTTTTEATTTTTTTTETTTTLPEEIKLLGDLNCDNQISIGDVVFLARYVSQDDTLDLSDTGRENADFNSDSSIDADDITALTTYMAGM